MLRSMTAYGRATTSSSIGRISVEIQSVNRKFLDINISLPKELLRFEIEIKKWISSVVARGQVTVKIFALFENVSPLTINPNLALAKQIKNACAQIAETLGLVDRERFEIQMLRNQADLLLYNEELQDEGAYLEAIRSCFSPALDSFIKMKHHEGQQLYQDISGRLTKLRQAIKVIEGKAPDAVKKYHDKLKERIEQVVPGHIENEERILREICLYAEKLDIAEEITRFTSHLDQFDRLLKSQESSVGKTLEFILQEMLRETNTIGSKASEITVTQHVVEIKSELERIREQIQNVE